MNTESSLPDTVVSGETQPMTAEVTQTAPESSLPEPASVPAEGSEPAPAVAEPVIETPVVESSADAHAPAAESAAAEAATTEPRVQLRPTVDPEMHKAVPNVALEEPTAAAIAAVAAAAAAKMEPVEIPREREMTLDEATAAQINAAMAGGATGSEAAANDGEAGLKPGTKVKGTVASVTGDALIIDLGGARASGSLPVRSYEGKEVPAVGAVLDLVIEKYDSAEGLVHLKLPRAVVSKPAGNWDAVKQGDIVDAMVTKSNKGGLEVSVSNLRGFMPASQVDFGFVSNLDQFVGQKVRVKILEVNPAKKNLVVSRRSFMEEERKSVRDEAWKTLEVGQKKTGIVRTLKDYGAFVDVGGVDGLLHVGEISWNRISHPKDVLAEGQSIEVQIIAIDHDKQKVSLGMKQLQQSPWASIVTKYTAGSVVRGKVTKTTEFGAFIELETGVEGMVHISELEHRRVARVTDILRVAQEVDVKVLNVDVDKKRIALSIKALQAKPESAKAYEPEPELSPYERKRRGPLKGGGTGSGGLMFGRPEN